MYGGSTRRVNRKSVMELHGAKDYFDCNMAIIATNGEIWPGASVVAEKLGVEILKLEFDFDIKSQDISSKTFESIWANYIIPLMGKELIRADGSKNIIVDVDWGQVTRITSNGNENKINIETFKEAYSILLRDGSVTREYINQNYPGRASSGVVLILSHLPFVEFKKNPARLVLIEDETTYLLKSPANAAR